MKKYGVLAAGVCAAVLVGAAPAKKAAANDPPPVASYWMDVSTTSGLGAGMSPGSRPSMDQIMGMMSGRASVGHSLDLRLASRDKPAGAPQADHWIPAGLQMGSSLPLVTPAREEAPRSPTGMPAQWQQPRGRMLIYWGCGEHVGPNQPTVIDFSKIAPGQVPPGMQAFANMARTVSGPISAPGFGRWPNDRDNRQVPAAGSLVGAHSIKGNYSPEIQFSLASGQDFMPALGLREAGALPSGASRLQWQLSPMATGYALSLFGGSANGDVIVWTSSKTAGMVALDYLAPAEVKRLIASGAVLPPTTNECLLPAEVAAAVPAGMVMGIGYGPEVDFAEKPKAPTWTAKVRFKTTASVMHGMQGVAGDGMSSNEAPPQQPEQPKKKKRLGIGDFLGGVVPH